MLIAEFDRREGWASWEVTSCAHWLAWKCGVGLHAAREHVRVARALESLPTIAGAFAARVLSYSKVRALTRMATPMTDGSLAELARSATASHLERLAREWRRGDPQDPRSQHTRRYVRTRWDDDGSFVLQGRLPPEGGAGLPRA